MSIDLDLIRRSNPLPEYCKKRGIVLRESRGALVGRCPIPGETIALAFVVSGDHWRCVGRGNKSGDVIDLEQALGGGTRAEAAERLTDWRSGITPA